MNLTDRRLLIELGVILAVKLTIIILLKVHFFGPAPFDPRHPLAVEATAPSSPDNNAGARRKRDSATAEEDH